MGLPEGPDAAIVSLPREFIAAILDAVAHPIFVKDRNFRFVLLNRALCEMVGHPRDAMLGKTDYDFFPRAEADFFRQKDLEMFASGQTTVIDEEPITDAFGGVHILATSKVPLKNASGETTHVVGIVHDITRLKAAEEALRRSNEELESRVAARTEELVRAQRRLLAQERLAVLGQLAGGLAHQIRNPLAAITNAGFVLRRLLREHPDGDARRAAEIVLEEAASANLIVTDLVDFARIRAPDRRPVALFEIVDGVLRTLELPASIRVQCDLPELPPVGVDARQVHDALANLCQNALEAMANDGGVLTLSARLDDGAIVLTVEDTGPGLSREVTEHLFEPLITTKPHGLGLGLTTARHLVETQGGALVFVKRPRGARFDVRLPIA
jgi:PAS domain S-box-containing protein